MTARISSREAMAYQDRLMGEQGFNLVARHGVPKWEV